MLYDTLSNMFILYNNFSYLKKIFINLYIALFIFIGMTGDLYIFQLKFNQLISTNLLLRLNFEKNYF